MQAIHKELVAFHVSPLYEERIQSGMQPVIGEGSLQARVVFIGEAPGKKEALSGRPFCGASGKVLDQLLEESDLAREDVYITNIVKDRPPNNRDPKPEEITLYGPFLDRQLFIIQPQIIATLGRFSMEYILRRYGLEDQLRSISEAHGVAHTAITDFGPVCILPLYHPAVAVYNRKRFDELLTDMQLLNSFYSH
ncbi:TPA: uracil-DNA glycosylase [Candidatus Uhrbacteria bacterium]|nr:uracil-DNA glycosylase [Candidatus Uhrbacteria bacterium]